MKTDLLKLTLSAVVHIAFACVFGYGLVLALQGKNIVSDGPATPTTRAVGAGVAALAVGICVCELARSARRDLRWLRAKRSGQVRHFDLEIQLRDDQEIKLVELTGQGPSVIRVRTKLVRDQAEKPRDFRLFRLRLGRWNIRFQWDGRRAQGDCSSIRASPH